jgi:hypothetical protein
MLAIADKFDIRLTTFIFTSSEKTCYSAHPGRQAVKEAVKKHEPTSVIYA